MTDVTIRPATPDDAALILRFITELAEYEKAAHEVKATVESIFESLFGEEPKAKAVICLCDGEPAGFALYFYNYSTWLGKHGLYLEDLYVTPAHRKSGAGAAMLKHLAKLAVDKDCGRFEWSVLDWNEPAINFYEKLGAVAQKQWTTYRLTGDSLQRLAGD
ncbi:MAG: GNAT family N-acetyltransferase [Gammaproteobacteria bacterium]